MAAQVVVEDLDRALIVVVVDPVLVAVILIVIVAARPDRIRVSG